MIFAARVCIYFFTYTWITYSKLMQFHNLYIICTVHLELRLNSSLTVSIVSALQVSVEMNWN